MKPASTPPLDRFLRGMPLEYFAIEGMMVHGTWRADVLVVTKAANGELVKELPMTAVEAEEHYRRIVGTAQAVADCDRAVERERGAA